MSSKRRITFVLSVVVLLSVLPPGPAMAFTEGANSFFGAGAGDDPGNAGVGLSFFGTNAGTSNTTGNDNAFFGRDAGLSNTTGSENAFFGSAAGFSNSTGSTNAFFGDAAGVFNTTGSDKRLLRQQRRRLQHHRYG